MNSDYHLPVLLKESVDALNIQKDGIYVDVTFGGGGHSREILKRLQNGSLIAFDQDADALENANNLKADFQARSFTLVESNFRYLRKYLRLHGIEKVDGILADLGVSSHQFDEAQRGFSTRFDGDIDMRMDTSQTKTGKTIINEYAEKDLIHIFSAYGEIRNARTLASAIVKERAETPINTTQQLVAIANKLAPKNKWSQYSAQLFQAIRIEVNDELSVLRDLLEQCAEVIKPDGRLVVISYHSLEDRLVKNFIASGNVKGSKEKDFYGNLIRPFEPVNRKPIVPEQDEITVNNRARSAKLRIANRILWQ